MSKFFDLIATVAGAGVLVYAGYLMYQRILPDAVVNLIDYTNATNTPSSYPPQLQSSSSAGGINQTAALNFIKNSYKPSVQMLEEAPGFNVYWLWNDQLLGQLALKNTDPALAKTIENKMNSYRIAMKTPWATLDPKYRNNFSIHHASEPTISTNPLIRYSDYGGAGTFSYSHADIAFLSAIHYFYLGDMAKAREAYEAGKRMWDGVGMKDGGNITGDYAVYKVALGLLAGRITGFPPVGIPSNYFAKFQASNGGIMTDIIGGKPAGSQNIETTAVVLFAVNPTLLGVTGPRFSGYGHSGNNLRWYK